MTKILIADDHLVVATGTEHILRGRFPDLEVEIAEDFEESIKLVQQYNFDIVLLDINLPGGNRIAMIESMRLRQPGIPILIFSAMEEPIYAPHYIKAGADGFLSKKSTKEELLTAVEYVLRGKKYLSQQMQQTYITNMFAPANTLANFLDRLTSREVQVMNLLLSGLSTNMMASHLSVSASAVSNYKSRIFEKLSVNSVMELSELLSRMDR